MPTSDANNAHMDNRPENVQNAEHSTRSPENNGGNGGHDDVVFTEESCFQQVVHRRKKRKHASSTDSVDFDKFKTMSVDDKLGVLFKNSHSQSEAISNIESKMNSCLKLKDDIATIQSTLDGHAARVTMLEYKSIDLEARSRRKNLLFLGFRENRDECCADSITQFLSETLEIEKDVHIDRAHRLGRYRRESNRPIIVAFRDFGDTQLILSRANKLQGSPYSINKDYPSEIVSARKALWGTYKTLKRDNPDKRVNIVYPAKILMNGQVVRDAFPRWSEVMQGSRLEPNLGTHSSNQARSYAARTARAAGGENRSHSSESSGSTASDDDSHSPNRRRRPRSRSRRSSAHVSPRDQQRRQDRERSSANRYNRNNHNQTTH